MNLIALKMLVGDRAKYFGIIMGLTFASLLITQQAAIFIGLMTRTFGAITDLSLPEIWVMDAKVQFIDDIKPLQDTELLRVRGVSGVDWAVPLYKGLLKARLDNGTFQTCNVLGLDDASLIGGPPIMVEGKLADLRRSEAVIVDEAGAKDKLAHVAPDGNTKIPLKVGDTLELNDHRAVVVGLCRVTRTFQSQPVIYTTYSRATLFAPRERKLLSFVLVNPKEGIPAEEVCRRITSATGLGAYTKAGFQEAHRAVFHEKHGDSHQFRHRDRARLHRRDGHCRADVLQLHAGQPPPFRRAQGDGDQQRNAAADDPDPGGDGRHDRVRHRRRAASVFGFARRTASCPS
jgi:putative ABC transport system permease protein